MTHYADVDGDGYGDDSTADSCTVPAGNVTVGGDCDDGADAEPICF